MEAGCNAFFNLRMITGKFRKSKEGKRKRRGVRYFDADFLSFLSADLLAVLVLTVFRRVAIFSSDFLVSCLKRSTRPVASMNFFLPV